MWRSKIHVGRYFFQVNFVELMRLKGLATQGSQDANQWVRSYTGSYNTEEMNFVSYKEGRASEVNTLPPVDTWAEVIFIVIAIGSLDS